MAVFEVVDVGVTGQSSAAHEASVTAEPRDFFSGVSTSGTTIRRTSLYF